MGEENKEKTERNRKMQGNVNHLLSRCGAAGERKENQ